MLIAHPAVMHTTSLALGLEARGVARKAGHAVLIIIVLVVVGILIGAGSRPAPPSPIAHRKRRLGGDLAHGGRPRSRRGWNTSSPAAAFRSGAALSVGTTSSAGRVAAGDRARRPPCAEQAAVSGTAGAFYVGAGQPSRVGRLRLAPRKLKREPPFLGFALDGIA